MRPFLTVCSGFPNPLKIRYPLPVVGPAKERAPSVFSVTHCSGRSQGHGRGDQRNQGRPAGPLLWLDQGWCRERAWPPPQHKPVPSPPCRERGQASSRGSPAQEMTLPVRLVLEPSCTGAPDHAHTPGFQKLRHTPGLLRRAAGRAGPAGTLRWEDLVVG